MAQICIDGGDVVVRLGLLEKLGALHGNVRIPRSAVIAVRTVEDPFAEIKGVRFPGTGVSGLVALGTWRHQGMRDFVCVYRRQGGVVIEIDQRGAAYERVILSSKDPNEIRKLLGM